MPRDFNDLHPRWPEGAPMGLGGQFRPTGLPSSAARILLGAAKLLDELSVGRATKRRLKERVKAANTAAGEVDWSYYGESMAARGKMRSILREHVFDGTGRDIINNASGAPIVQSQRPRSAAINAVLVRSGLEGSNDDELSRMARGDTPSPTGALASRLSATNPNPPATFVIGDRVQYGRRRLEATVVDNGTETSPGVVIEFDEDSTAVIAGRPMAGRRFTAQRDLLSLTSAGTTPRSTSDSTPNSPARSPTGRIRNIRAMTDENLISLAIQMRSHRTDTDAVTRINDELRSRNRSSYEIPAGNPTAPSSGSGRTQNAASLHGASWDDENEGDFDPGQPVTVGGSRATIITTDEDPGSATVVFNTRAIGQWADGNGGRDTSAIVGRGGVARIPARLLEADDNTGHDAQLHQLSGGHVTSQGWSIGVFTEGGPFSQNHFVGLLDPDTGRHEGNLAGPFAGLGRAQRVAEELSDVHDVPLHAQGGAVPAPQAASDPVQVTRRTITGGEVPVFDMTGSPLLRNTPVLVNGVSRGVVASSFTDAQGRVEIRESDGTRSFIPPDDIQIDYVPQAGHVVRLRPGGDRRHPWLHEGRQYRVTDATPDDAGDISLVQVDGDQSDTLWARPDQVELASILGRRDQQARAQTAQAAADNRPHPEPINSQQLAENIISAFEAANATNRGDEILQSGDSLAIRTPPSGAVSRIVRVRRGRDETFAYIRHRGDGQGTAIGPSTQHQISFIHGSDEILGSALRPGQFRARPRGGAHRLFTREQSEEAAEVLANALRSSSRRSAPAADPNAPATMDRRRGQIPLPGMMARTNRRPTGWHADPSGDMEPPRDGDERAFGLEIEMTGITFGNARTALSRAGLPVDERSNYSLKNFAAWCACEDASLGVGDPEIKFPPLSGEQGFALMRRAVQALRDAGGRAGRQSTHGMHVHIDARDMPSNEKRLELAETYKNNRDLINTIVAPNRNRGSGAYAREGYSTGHGSNELALNLGSPTIEFRRLGSNLVADDLEGWATLMRCIVQYTKTHDGALPTQSSLLQLMQTLNVPIAAQEKILARVARITPTVNED